MSNLFIRLTGALLGMLAVAGGFYLSRKWLIPWLHVDLTSKPYDPVAAKVGLQGRRRVKFYPENWSEGLLKQEEYLQRKPDPTPRHDCVMDDNLGCPACEAEGS